ncbi:hypothetical protein SELMODRAFT_448028 [Selaginella moellendorffii]|uniref:THO1-MOS11 C-terminal domain-containing protein n=1 Tax=Selaginella moellendorffii TaxID=88036 RepID=D8T4C5_SELML|nr:hypothetical protein SELMODRAFT_448028 [Selaginella moellendorffii]
MSSSAAPDQEEAQSKAAAAAAAVAAEVEQGSSPEVNDAVGSESGAAAQIQAEDSGNGQVEAADGNSRDGVSVENGGKEEGVVCLESPGPLSDMEKKQRRAERFGVGLNFSEDEKRKLRASRFNASDKKGVSKAKVSIESETEKKNARAARFGTANVASANEDAKKRARLDRFSGVDSNLEAEKKKARAARFAATSNEENLKKKLGTDTTPELMGKSLLMHLRIVVTRCSSLLPQLCSVKRKRPVESRHSLRDGDDNSHEDEGGGSRGGEESERGSEARGRNKHENSGKDKHGNSGSGAKKA